MATPLAHSAVGLAFGLARFRPLEAGNPEARPGPAWRPLAVCVILANAPDVDYLFGLFAGRFNAFHQTVTHTGVWVAALALALWLLARGRRRTKPGWSFPFLLALLGSHLLLDWLTADYSPPAGLTIGWPWSDRIWHASVSLFPAPAKSGWASLASWHNLRVLAWEAALTLPLPALAWLIQSRRSGNSGSTGSRAAVD